VTQFFKALFFRFIFKTNRPCFALGREGRGDTRAAKRRQSCLLDFHEKKKVKFFHPKIRPPKEKLISMREEKKIKKSDINLTKAMNQKVFAQRRVG
jgi:hypothetical protein